jgi:hypothetical protein
METTVNTIEVVTDLPQRLRAANNAQRGSFGEFLFAEVAQQELDADVRAIRRNRTDFIYGDRRIDVKTTIRDVGQSLRPLAFSRICLKNLSAASWTFELITGGLYRRRLRRALEHFWLPPAVSGLQPRDPGCGPGSGVPRKAHVRLVERDREMRRSA